MKACTLSDKRKNELITQVPSQKLDTVTLNKGNQSNLSADEFYDSIANADIDTLTLNGKRQLILNRFINENRLSSPTFDTLLDLTYDGFKDYIIGYYGQSGTGIKNRIRVYFFDSNKENYILNKELSTLPNPTFYIKLKKITGFYLGNGGGDGARLEWIKGNWTITKEFSVDNQGDSTIWYISYPLKKKTEELSRPYQFVPPADILETDIELQ